MTFTELIPTIETLPNADKFKLMQWLLSQQDLINKINEPTSTLSANNENITPRKLGGSWEGKVKISEGFNETDENFINDFYQGAIFPENK